MLWTDTVSLIFYNFLKMSRERQLFKALFCLGIANISPNKRECGKNTRNDAKNIKLRIRSHLFLKLVDSAIHWITQLVSLIFFPWTVIYQVDNTIHRLNNWSQMFKYYDSGRLITSRLVVIFKSEGKYCIIR